MYMNNLTVTEYKNIRVLTTQQIADAYGTDSKTISYNFNHNKGRYKEGKHFILLDGEELRAFREIHDLPSNLNRLYLWTEKGRHENSRLFCEKHRKYLYKINKILKVQIRI